MTKPATYDEWRQRRNGIAEKLCSALQRSEGGVCGCLNGDEDPDRVHFSSCAKMVTAADAALAAVGVPVPAKSP